MKRFIKYKEIIIKEQLIITGQAKETSEGI